MSKHGFRNRSKFGRIFSQLGNKHRNRSDMFPMIYARYIKIHRSSADRSKGVRHCEGSAEMSTFRYVEPLRYRIAKCRLFILYPNECGLVFFSLFRFEVNDSLVGVVIRKCDSEVWLSIYTIVSMKVCLCHFSNN